MNTHSSINLYKVLLTFLPLLFVSSSLHAFPFIWDPYLRYLNVQVEEAVVPDGGTYWRVAEGYAIPPPDQGFGEVKITFQTKDENGSGIGGIPIRIFSSGGTLQNTMTPGEFFMGGGNWSDFYNQIGPYWLTIDNGQPSEVLKGLGLPVNQHFSYIIVFQRAIKGVTPTAPQPVKLGKPDGTNLLFNPGAEQNFRGWSQNGMVLDGDIFNNVGNRAGIHRFSWAAFNSGTGWLEQSVALTPGSTYTFGFWVAKKSSQPQLTLTASWSDNNGGSGTLYQMPAGETIYPIYGTRQDKTFVPKGGQVTVRVAFSYTGSDFAGIHLDELWLVDVTPVRLPEATFLVR